MIRGNHEHRDVQEHFTFRNECMKRFGPDLGSAMWSEINSVFDCMPLAAVVDGRIFCTHGGIPEERKYETLGFREAVNSVPCPLPDPENQSPLAWVEMDFSDKSSGGANKFGRKSVHSMYRYSNVHSSDKKIVVAASPVRKKERGPRIAPRCYTRLVNCDNFKTIIINPQGPKPTSQPAKEGSYLPLTTKQCHLAGLRT